MTARIDELIAASSIGEGLRDIEERGIDAHVADLEQEMAPKKRAKRVSPTERCLRELKRRGWTAGVVERHSPWPKPQGTTYDLFGCIDLVAMVPHCVGSRGGIIVALERPAILGIQATSGTNHAARREKIIAEPRMVEWLATGARLELWSWSKRARGRTRWTLRVERFEMRDGVLVGVEDA